MKKLVIFFLVFSAILMNGCRTNNPEGDTPLEEKSSLKINFVAKAGNDFLIMDEGINYPSGYKVKFSDFQIVISDFKIFKRNGSDITFNEVFEIDRLNFTQQNLTEELAKDGIDILNSNVLVDNYDGLMFNIGITQEQNQMNPSDFGENHPLSDTSMYKEEWGSYIFAKMVGKADKNNTLDYPLDFFYEVGENSVCEKIEYTKQIPIIKDEVTEINIEIDIIELFKTGETPLNIIEYPNTNGLTGGQISSFFLGNIYSAINIK